MAWQVFKGVESASDLDKELDIHADLEEVEEDVAAQLKVAKAAAKAIIKSGALGDFENLHVHMGGNAAVDPGNANGAIQVSVSVGKYK